MSFKEILELINTIDKSQISFMELNYEDLYLKLDKSLNRNEVVSSSSVVVEQPKVYDNTNIDIKSEGTSLDKEVIREVEKQVEEDQNDDNFQYIIAPVVGTVYLSPSPGKSPYVVKDQEVKNGEVVCIIEAMKLMNEIESEYSGKIVEVLVKNAQMVEYGQKLFKIKKD